MLDNPQIWLDGQVVTGFCSGPKEWSTRGRSSRS